MIYGSQTTLDLLVNLSLEENEELVVRGLWKEINWNDLDGLEGVTTESLRDGSRQVNQILHGSAGTTGHINEALDSSRVPQSLNDRGVEPSPRWVYNSNQSVELCLSNDEREEVLGLSTEKLTFVTQTIGVGIHFSINDGRGGHLDSNNFPHTTQFQTTEPNASNPTADVE
jgi:hypothetical protein